MKAVILAAGDGGRLGAIIPKILLEVGGKTILDHHINGLKSINIEEAIIITGYKKNLIEEYVKGKKLNDKLKITIVYNDKYNVYENGYSVLCSRDYIDAAFLMIMGDHMIDYSALSEVITENPPGLLEVIDTKPKFANIDHATKVLVKDGLIVDSGKKLKEFNAIDTGFFIVPLKAFDILEKNKNKGKTEWNECVKKFANEGIKTFDLESAFWVGINTQEDFESAKKNIHMLNQSAANEFNKRGLIP